MTGLLGLSISQGWARQPVKNPEGGLGGPIPPTPKNISGCVTALLKQLLVFT